MLSIFAVASSEKLAASVLLVGGVSEGASEVPLEAFRALLLRDIFELPDSARLSTERREDDRRPSWFCRNESIICLLKGDIVA